MKYLFKLEGDVKKKDEEGKPVIVRDLLFVISETGESAKEMAETFASNVVLLNDNLPALGRDWH